MSKINITGTRVCNDPHYRYTMPVLSLHHEGRGNGQKTVILNLSDICDCLDIPLDLLIRYFSVELSAQCRKESDTSRVVINGSYTYDQLLHTLNTFIDVFILCPNCGLPETSLGIKKDQVRHKCRSCGNKTPITSDHKLVKYILKMFGKP